METPHQEQSCTSNLCHHTMQAENNNKAKPHVPQNTDNLWWADRVAKRFCALVFGKDNITWSAAVLQVHEHQGRRPVSERVSE